MIEHRYRGVRHPSRPGKWLAQFQAPAFGLRYARDASGAPVQFDDEESATRAALAAMMRALNEATKPPVNGKVLVVRRNDARGKWERLFSPA